MGNRTNHQVTVSELPFTVRNSDLNHVLDYVGRWVLTGEGPVPENYWVVTVDGRGHPMTGHDTPQQMLDNALDDGLNVAYAAPYGRYVQGERDGVLLSDWIRERRIAGLAPPADGNQPFIADLRHS